MIEQEKILETYYFRHACKIFDTTKKIKEKDFLTILKSAQLSASSFGFEPWKFLVVQDINLREKLKEVSWGAQRSLPTASHFVIILARKQKSMRYDSDYITKMLYEIHKIPRKMAEQRRLIYKKFQEEDFRLFESERTMFDWATKQCYIALSSMMTTAAMLEIDSCAIEGFEAKKLEILLSDDFGIKPDEWGVAVMAAFGYRVEEQKEKTRQKLESIVEWFE